MAGLSEGGTGAFSILAAQLPVKIADRLPTRPVVTVYHRWAWRGISFAQKLDGAAQSPMFSYRATSAPDDCNISIAGSTPVAASIDHPPSALSRRRRSVFAYDCSRRPANSALSPGSYDTSISGRLAWAR